MIKKLVLAGGALALLSSVTLGVPLVSYTRCGVDWLRDSANETMPVEWELTRARQMIADLKPEIQHNAKLIAKEKVQVVRLRTQLDDTQSRLTKSESDIQRLSEDLRSNNSSYTYAGKTYTYTQVKNDLSNRFKRFKTREQTADKLQQMLSAREATLQAAEDRMETMLSARRQLEVEVENLQARLSALRVEQTSSKLNLDNSHLSKTRELLDEISARIDVEEETTAVSGEYFGEEIDLDETSEGDLLDEIAVHFGESEGSDALVAIKINVD